jgi:hypothetical protein
MLAHLSQTLTPKHLEISKEVEGKMVEVDEEEEVMLIHRRKRSIVLIVERKNHYANKHLYHQKVYVRRPLFQLMSTLMPLYLL